MPLALIEKIRERAGRRSNERFDLLFIVLPLQDVSPNALTEDFAHEVVIIDGAVKHNMIPIINFVDQGAIDAEAIHVARGASVEAAP